MVNLTEVHQVAGVPCANIDLKEWVKRNVWDDPSEMEQGLCALSVFDVRPLSGVLKVTPVQDCVWHQIFIMKVVVVHLKAASCLTLETQNLVINPFSVSGGGWGLAGYCTKNPFLYFLFFPLSFLTNRWLCLSSR